MTQIKNFQECATDQARLPDGWGFRLIQNEDNLTYLLWSTKTGEGIIVDPQREDFNETLELVRQLKKSSGENHERVPNEFRVTAVIDTHTHADHISSAADLAAHFSCPLVMHENAPSPRVNFAVRKDTLVPTAFGSYQIFLTPGHTQDSITVLFGPFLLTGDTIIYGDTGRDDLPTGNAETHFESLQKIKSFAKPDLIFLPGHDGNGRVCSWATQVKENSSLTQLREQFVPEAASYRGPSPKNLKESLFENFK